MPDMNSKDSQNSEKMRISCKSRTIVYSCLENVLDYNFFEEG